MAKQYARMTLPWTDSLFFMEYLTPIGVASQEGIAVSLRKWGVKKPMVGLVHLPESLLLKYWSVEYIHEAVRSLDFIVTYGSSLAGFFGKLGYRNKVKETFHYVDTEYYRPILNGREDTDPFKVIVVGSLLRDVQLLKEIVHHCPDVIFQICGGINDLKPVFGGYANVRLTGYVSENELLKMIQGSDAGLSVMKDTVGSNAIVCGLACGLPQIVSDVGSIRDYCSEENSFFCKSRDDFIKAFRLLKENRAVCSRMGSNARQRAEELSLPKSVSWFENFLSREVMHGHGK